MSKQKGRPGFSEDAAAYRSLPRRGSEPLRLPDGTVRYGLTLGPKGRVLLPANLRAALGLSEGDVIVGWLKDGQLRLESQQQSLRKIQQDLRKRVGDKSLIDELIAERRAAAARGE